MTMLARAEILSAVELPLPLELLFNRSCILAERVAIGDIPFIEAVDMAYSAAALGGLVDHWGDDAVQTVLAAAFMECPRGLE